MKARNPLTAAPPYPVETALRTLGANLRTARLRRRLTTQEMATKIGVGRDTVAEAERGKPSTAVAVYVALLWALGLVDQMADLADPAADREGLALAMGREPRRARPKETLDNDF